LAKTVNILGFTLQCSRQQYVAEISGHILGGGKEYDLHLVRYRLSHSIKT